jgi:hypothetical protein
MAETTEKQTTITFPESDWKYIMECIHRANDPLLYPTPDDFAVRICNKICDATGIP